MIGLVLRRLAGLVLTLVAVSALIFAVMNVLPGDAAAIMLGRNQKLPRNSSHMKTRRVMENKARIRR